MTQQVARSGMFDDPDRLRYGLVVAVDIEKFSRLDTHDQGKAQEMLATVLEFAALHAGQDRSRCYLQQRGDGELAVLPPDTDVAGFIGDYCDGVAAALRECATRSHLRLRLRLAMDYGTLRGGAFGPVGDPPIVASRLLDSTVARRTLAAVEHDLVVILSDRIYRDIVLTRVTGLAPARFRAVRVPGKGTSHLGHICAGSPHA
jgi:hypothetical protein